jgi:hypothetical protein
VLTTLDVVGVEALSEPEVESSSCQAVYAAAPPTPAAPPTRRDAATTDPAKATRRLRRGAGGGPAGALGEGCPAYGRHVGGVSGGGGSGVVSPVLVTTTKVPSGTVTILRHRWVSQKKIGLCSGTMPP